MTEPKTIPAPIPANPIPPASMDIGDMRLLTYQVGELKLALDKFVVEIRATFSTKAEVTAVESRLNIEITALKSKLDGVYSGVWWALKIVGGAILIAVLSLVLQKVQKP